MLAPCFDIFDSLRQEILARPDLLQQRAKVLAGGVALGWSVVDDLLLFRGRVFVLADSAVWATLLADAHHSGHKGTQKILHRLCSQFHVPGMCRLVQEFVHG